MNRKKTNYKQIGFIFFIIVGISAIGGLLGGSRYYYNFLNALFYISGFLIILSGFRFVHQRGGYKFFSYVVYNTKKIFRLSSISKKNDFVDQKEEELLGNKSKKNQKKEKKLEDFINQKIDIKSTNTNMFVASFLTLILSFVLVFV